MEDSLSSKNLFSESKKSFSPRDFIESLFNEIGSAIQQIDYSNRGTAAALGTDPDAGVGKSINSLAKIFDVVNGVLSPGILYNKVINGEDTIDDWVNTTASIASGLVAVGIAGPEIAAVVTALSVYNFVSGLGIGKRLGQVMAQGIIDRIYNHGLKNPDTGELLLPPHNGDGSTRTPDPNGDPANAISPIILDLDGDGIETLSTQDGVNFDHDGNAFAENSGWVSRDDGLLVLDRNNDGAIDTGNELFGSNTRLKDGSYAENGYLALQELDDNNDGLINSEDAIWAQLNVWQDKNGDARVDEGELLTLDELGIASISTQYNQSSYVDDNGNAHKQMGEMTMSDGTVRQSTDVWFNVNPGSTTYGDDIVIPESVRQLPYIRGFGNIASLHVAMTENPELRLLVEQYIADPLSENAYALLEEIVFTWAGVSDIAVDSRGQYIDARHLATIEAASGENYQSKTNGTVDPRINAAALLDEQYKKFVSYIESRLLSQTLYAEDFALVKLTINKDLTGFALDFEAFEQHLDSLKSTDFGRFLKVSNMLYNMLEYEPLLADVRQRLGISGEFLSGSSEDDFLKSPGAKDYILWGNEGDDNLVGAGGNDVIAGGKGNDTLHGGSGNDTYLFNLGDGQDLVRDAYSTSTSNSDTLIFGEGLLAQNARLTHSGNNLVISFEGSDDCVTIVDYFFYDALGYRVERFVFADGTTWDEAAVKAMLIAGTDEAQTLIAHSEGSEIHGLGGNDTLKGNSGDDKLYGDEGNDTLTGSSGNDALYGGAGNDSLDGGNGDDVLLGGEGNDWMAGGSGSDTYLFNLGDGQDTITDGINDSGTIDMLSFGDGLLAQNARLTHSGNNLVISFEGSEDRVTVTNYFYASRYQIESIVFNDGTVWDVATVKAMLIAGTDEAQTLIAHSEGSEIHGLGGNDTLKGNSGDDKLYGDEGNDTLTGSSGNDALYGGAGNDSLDGGSWDDVLHGGEGNDKLAGGSGSDTYLFNLGDGQDTVTEGSSNSGNSDTLSFGEGLLAQNARLTRSGNNLVITFEGSDDRVTVTDYFYSSRYQVENIVFTDGTVWDVATVKAMVIVGTDEAQTLIAYGEGSEIHGLGGDDTLKGNSGDDKLYGGAGNDSLDGGNGNDVLHGGVGNDKLAGYSGSDTYLFNAGDGQDTIYDSYSNNDDSDTLRFGEGLQAQNARLTRSGNNLVITFEGSDDRVTVTDYFYSSRYQVENIFFADGIVWDVATVKAMLIAGTDEAQTLIAHGGGSEIHGLGGNDTLKGYSGDDKLYGDEGDDNLTGDIGNDMLYGGAGNDSLRGESGNDFLHGGMGDDQLNGFTGSDTYLFNLGDGKDTITDNYRNSGDSDTLRFGEGLLAQNARLTRSGNDLVISFEGCDDRVTITGYLYSSLHQVENIVFADGTVWEPELVKAMLITGTDEAQTLVAYGEGSEIHGLGGNDTLKGNSGDDKLYGDEGNDTLTGSSGNDALYGGAGNDSLRGESGNDFLHGGMGDDQLNGFTGSDTYLFNLGDGKDTITDNYRNSSDSDTLRFGEGLLAQNARLTRSGNDLVISFEGCDDSVTITGYLYSSLYQVENIVFADGTVWEPELVKAMLIAGTDEAQTLVAYGEGSEIRGLGGNDTLKGNSGGDKLYGDEGDDNLAGDSGNDMLYGGAGNDSLNGNSGNDVLDGGSGNDHLYGEYGCDTYLFNAGDGQDTITEGYSSSNDIDTLSFGEDLQAQNARLTRSGNHLVISFEGSDDRVTVTDYFYSSRYQVEHISFADGTDWLPEDILNYMEDDIPLPLAASADAPVSLQLIREQMVAFTGGDDDAEDSVGDAMPTLSTSRSSVSALMHF